MLCAHFCLSQELVCIDVKQWFVWFYVHISVCLRSSYVLNIKQRRRKTSCADYYASEWIVFEEPSVCSLLEGNNWIWIVFEELGVCSLLEGNNWIWIVFEEPILESNNWIWIVFEELSVCSLLEGNNWIWIVFEELGVCSLLESNNWIWIVFEEPSVVRFLRVTIGFKDQCGICSR